MKNNIKIEWEIALRDSDTDKILDNYKKNLYLTIMISASDSNTAELLLSHFAEELNKLITEESPWHKGYLEYCGFWGDTDEGWLYDSMVFEKEPGYVNEQRREIRKLASCARKKALLNVLGRI